ncbi:MAG: type II toxin-antitoxin system RelE/ParE family toxin [Fimbriimonas sp.]|nr:type II toxin-antitoxin system RelE/ParE family toxin [Fimbriimonas sp.]
MVQTPIFIDPDTDKYARKQRWTDDLLVKAVDDVEQGLNDGPLGSGVYKPRVAREGAGSAAGYRVVVVIRIGERAFIVEAFAENMKKTHTPPEIRALRSLADSLLPMADEAFVLALNAGHLRELKRNHETDEDTEL